MIMMMIIVMIMLLLLMIMMRAMLSRSNLKECREKHVFPLLGISN